MTHRLIRLPEVMNRTGLRRSTIYDLIKKEEFPRQSNITVRAVGWVEDEIHDWIVKRLKASRGV